MKTPSHIYWHRFQCRLAALYHRRVTLPFTLWQACGRPPQFPLRLPWWHRLVHSYLCGTGWYKLPRRPRTQRPATLF